MPRLIRFFAVLGAYGEWLFEIAWTEAENVATDDEAAFFGGAGSDGQGADAPADGAAGEREDIPDPTQPPAGGNNTGPNDLPEADGDTASGGVSATVRDGRNR